MYPSPRSGYAVIPVNPNQYGTQNPRNGPGLLSHHGNMYHPNIPGPPNLNLLQPSVPLPHFVPACNNPPVMSTSVPLSTSVPMYATSYQAPMPVFLSDLRPRSPVRSREPSGDQGQVRIGQSECFQQGVGQGNFYPQGPFSPPLPQHSGSCSNLPPMSSPPVPPPLFRPGPYTPTPKLSIQEERHLNKTEKEDLYRTFGVVLQQHGPLEVTDGRLLSVFMGLSPWMRQGIKYLGGLKDFFRQASIFTIDRDVVSLAWQGYEGSGIKKHPSGNDQCTRARASDRLSQDHRVRTTEQDQDYAAGSKEQRKDTRTSASARAAQSVSLSSTYSNKPSSTPDKAPKDEAQSGNKESTGSEDSDDGDDDEWEGEEEEQGWWLLDPIPGEEDDWNFISPLQGRIGGGYFDDFRQLEEQDNKDPEEVQKKLLMTSSPTWGSRVKQKSAEKPKSGRNTALSWEELAIEQQAQAALKWESVKKADKTGSRSDDGDDKGSKSETCFSKEESQEGESVSGDYDEYSAEVLVYRSGSLHQADDDVILVEVVEEDSTDEDGDAVVLVTSVGNEDEQIGGDCPATATGAASGASCINTIPENKVTVWEEAGEMRGAHGDGRDKGEFDMISKLNSMSFSEASPAGDCQVLRGDEQDTSFDAVKRHLSQESNRLSQESNTSSKQAFNISTEIDVGQESECNLSTVSSIDSKRQMRSVGMVTPKPEQVHKSICTKEVKTRSCKVNTMVIATIHRGTDTGEDPQMESYRRNLVRETQRCSALAADGEDLRDKLIRQKNQHITEMANLQDKLDQTTQDLRMNQRRLSGKETIAHSELHKVTTELKSTENRLNAAMSKIARSEKENSNLTRELEKTTRQLLDLEKFQADRANNRDRSTSTGGLEPPDEPAAESEESSLLKMRARSAEQKVLELQYQYAMQSLNKALQESQYIFRMYGNTLLSSSHREGLRVKWMDYQSYIKEHTDEVATAFYSALKALHQDIPLADIPSLKAQHIETFNPYKQSPVEAREFQFYNSAPPGSSALGQTFPTPAMSTSAGGGVEVPFDMYASLAANQDPAAPASQHMNDAAPSVHASTTNLCQPQVPPSQPPPGFTGATNPSQEQAPPGLTKMQVQTSADLSMPFMQAQTQRAAPGKVMRRVPRKTPKAFLAANFMSSLHHTTKVYGAKATAGDQSVASSGPSRGSSGRQSPANVHDWLDTMETENAAEQSQDRQSVAATSAPIVKKQPPPGFADPQTHTHMAMDTSQQVEAAVSQGSLTQQIGMPPRSSMARPTGIGRGRPVTNRAPQHLFTAAETQKAESMDFGIGCKFSSSESSDVTFSLSGASSRTSSRAASPFPFDPLQPAFQGASHVASQPPTGFQRGSPAEAPGADGSPETRARFSVPEQQGSSAAKMRSSSAGDAVPSSFTGSQNSPAPSRTLGLKVRSTSLGPAIRAERQESTTVQSSLGKIVVTTQQPSRMTNTSLSNFESGVVKVSYPKANTTTLPPRFRARQARMPYHRGAEGAGGPEEKQGGGGDSGGEGWTTQLSKRKRKALNLVEQQTQLIKEYRSLTRSHDPKAGDSAKGRGQSRKQGSLDKLVNYLSKQFKEMTRKELTDSILQVRLDHNGSLSGISMGTIISEASNYLSKSQKKMQRKASDVASLCTVCQDDMEGDPSTRKLDCGHAFHNKCIKVWVNEEGTCPICRKHTLFTEDFPKLN